MVISKPIINVYENPVTNEYVTINGEVGKSLRECLDGYSIETSVIMCNGRFISPEHVIQEGDLITLRIFPAGFWKKVKSTVKSAVSTVTSAVSSAVNTVVNAVKDVGSTVVSAVKTAYNWCSDGVSWFMSAWRKEAPDDVTPQEQQTENKKNEDGTVKENPTMSGQKNQSAKDSPIPIVLGSHIYTPKFIGQPYVRTIFDADGYGRRTELLALYLVAYNNIDVTNFRFKYTNFATNNARVTNGFIPIDGTSFSGIPAHLEVRNSGESQLYPTKVVQESCNIPIQHVSGQAVIPIEKFSASYPMTISMDVGFNGLFMISKENGNIQGTSCTLVFQYSLDGSNWMPFSYVSGAGAGFDPGSGRCTFSGSIKETIRYKAVKQFSYGELRHMIENDARNYVYMRVYRENADSTESNVCDKAYLLNVTTECFDRNASKNAGYLVGQSPFNPVYRDQTTRVAVCVQSNDAISGNLESLNLMAHSKCATWNGTSWVGESVTSNPASLVRNLMMHTTLGKHRFRESEIDLKKLGAVYEFCERSGYKCNAVIHSETKLGDTIQKILDVGHSFAFPVDGKYTFMIDKPQTVPCMVLNNHNFLMDGRTNSKSFEVLPDGLEITFNNKDLDYRQDVIRCMYDSSKEKQTEVRLEKVSYDFIDNRSQAWRHGKYNLLKKKYRPEVWNAKIGIEGELISIGALVAIQDDTILVGIGDGGSIVGIDYDEDMMFATGFTIDGEIPFSDMSKTYAVKFHKYNNLWSEPRTAVYKIKVPKEGMYRHFEFLQPVSLDEAIVPEFDDNVSFGVYDSITTDCICLTKRANDDYTFDLVMFPYDEHVYIYDDPSGKGWTENLPDFDTKITLPVQFSMESEVPKDYVKRDELVDAMKDLVHEDSAVIGAPDIPVIRSCKALRDSIRLRWDEVKGGLRNTIQAYVVYVSTDGGETFEKAGTTKELYYDYDIKGRYLEHDEFSIYRFKMFAMNVYASSMSVEDEHCSGYSDVAEVSTDDYGTWKPLAPIVTTRISDRTITLIMAQPTRADGRELYGTTRYKVSVRKPAQVIEGTSINAGEETEVEYFTPATSSDPYTSEENYRDMSEGAKGYVVSDGVYSQTMPLSGQETNSLVDTLYQFKVVAFNESRNESQFSHERDAVNAVALCTSIRDIIKANEDFKELYVSKLSAINANLGVIRQGSLTGDDNNFWALSDIPAEDTGSRAFKKGEFRVGDDEQYIKYTPPSMTESGKGELKVNADLKVEADVSNIRSSLNVYPVKEDEKIPSFQVLPDKVNPEKGQVTVNGIMRSRNESIFGSSNLDISYIRQFLEVGESVSITFIKE